MDVPARLKELAGAPRAEAVLAGQRAFDRLEWLGDSVLDVLVSRHLCLGHPSTVSVERLAQLHTAFVRDASLRRSAQRHALPPVQPPSTRGERPTPTRAVGRGTRSKRGSAQHGSWAAGARRRTRPRSWC